MPTGPLAGQASRGQAAAEGHPAGVSIVIVTYRNEADIGACLRAVGRAAPSIPVEAIVVDNASGDGTAAAARAVAGVKVIDRETNGGFAAGCATGAEAATGSWLLFLNPDTIIAPDALEALLDCATEHPASGIVGGRFVHPDGTSDPRSFWGRPSPWSALCFALGLTSLLPGHRFFDPEAPQPWSGDPAQERAVPVISGAFMLVRRELWDTLGGFDPVFFLYGEDADFCLRAAAAGFRPMVTARAVCQHAGGRSSTSAGKLVLLFTGKCTLVRRHFPGWLRTAGIGFLLGGVLLRATASRITGTAPATRQARPTARGEDWRALWAARAEWRRGWTA
ncbi:MAG: glycosyltransferase family 2 protein [Actinomycetia bacterium]|nr:glycosyltransferase family 2 protein [Actinomycetes bacterium]